MWDFSKWQGAARPEARPRPISAPVTAPVPGSEAAGSSGALSAFSDVGKKMSDSGTAGGKAFGNAISTAAQTFGGIFERLGAGSEGKNAPQGVGGGGSMASDMAPYQPMATGDRQALLQAMLARARGGRAGGAPTAPLPAPNSNIPTA